jgi:hypothetical protein
MPRLRAAKLLQAGGVMGKRWLPTCCASLVIAVALTTPVARAADADAGALWPSQRYFDWNENPDVPPLVFHENSVEASWYVRFDYFTWNEQEDRDRLLDESGVLYTIGYQRRMGAKRVRLELFEGTVHYSGETIDKPPIALVSTTGYIGVRGEAEYVWDFQVSETSTSSFFAGVGTRFWLRNLADASSVTTGQIVSQGYQETWWTLYPYVGLEKKWLLENSEEIFLSGRLGCTAVTYQDASLQDVAVDTTTKPATVTNITDSSPLWPSPGLTSQVECGLRYGKFAMSAYFDAMTWQASPIGRGGYFQPDSRMITVGLKFALCY